MENKTWTYADRYRHIKEVKIRHTEESVSSKAAL